MDQPEDKWRAESDARTLLEAHKIKSDGKRHSAAIGHLRSDMKARKAVVKGKKGKAPSDADMAAKGYNNC